MKIFAPVGINRKKLKYRTGKALFLIIPIIVLVILSVVATSQAKNIKKAMNDHIFKEIKAQGTVIEIEYPRESFEPGAGGGNQQSSASENQYTEVDLATIKSISNVQNASINYSLPISNIKTTDLFTDKTISFRNISALNEDMAGLYTQESFNYTDGEAIPIILNSSQLVTTYEDWGDKTTYTMDFRAMRESAQAGTTSTDPMQSSPVKTTAIEYTKDELLGKEFTITFGGFANIEDYTTTRSDGTTTMTKLTTSQLNTLIAARKTAVNKYWKYDTLANGVTYKFKVVGIVESNSNSNIFVPESFAKKVMYDYIDLQFQARLSNSISDSLLNTTYLGLTYNGTELNSTRSAMMFGGGRDFGRPGSGAPGSSSSSSSSQKTYEIPGLVIEVDENDSSEVDGIYSDKSVYETAVQTGDRINIKINDFLNRTQVVKDLNAKGYAYQDTSDYSVFSKVQDTLNAVSTGVIIGFIVLTISVIILTMSKFVSESRKEIGIYRAVGFTKGNILSIFLTQSIMYTAVGYIIGLGIGYGVNLLAGRFVAKWFESFVNNTVKQSFNVVGSIDTSVFNKIDLNSMLVLSGILLVVTVVISFIPAYKASVVSPVEAIKNE